MRFTALLILAASPCPATSQVDDDGVWELNEKSFFPAHDTTPFLVIKFYAPVRDSHPPCSCADTNMLAVVEEEQGNSGRVRSSSTGAARPKFSRQICEGGRDA